MATAFTAAWAADAATGATLPVEAGPHNATGTVENAAGGGGSRQDLALCTISLPRGAKIAEVRRRLVLLGRHQHTVSAQEIVLAADQNVVVVLGAIVFQPDRVVVAAIPLRDRP